LYFVSLFILNCKEGYPEKTKQLYKLLWNMIVGKPEMDEVY
jgi:hypothetical protein